MASTGEVWRLGHRPALDGIRALAVVLVLLAHSHATFLPVAGGAGVTIFFVLSGFLITSLLLDEREATGRLSLRGFYERRARRLLPALFAVLLVTALVGLVVGSVFVTPVQLFSAATYWSNWYTAQHGPVGALAHTWSLSVEEQFYIAWPLVVLACRARPRVLVWVATFGALAATMVRVALWDGTLAASFRVGSGTDTEISGVLIGCALAAIMRQHREGRARPVVATVAILLAVLTSRWAPASYISIGLTVTALLTAVAIWAVAQGDGVKWLAWSPLRWIGKRCYGLYLWHYMVAFGVWHLVGVDAPWALQLALFLPPSLLLTVLSWRYVEQPWLSRRALTVPVTAPAVGQLTPA